MHSRLIFNPKRCSISYSTLVALQRTWKTSKPLLLYRTLLQFRGILANEKQNQLVCSYKHNQMMKVKNYRIYHTDENEDSAFEEYLLEDTNMEEYQFLREICAIPNAGHHVFAIQPAIKWGSKKQTATTPELQLAELCALISTLPNWKVVRERIISVKHPSHQMLFGSGNFAHLKREINSCSDVSAVVLGMDLLSGTQLSELQNAWKIPVFDRYTIVLQIFKDHARTKEAKLQVALAEIPYIRSRLNQIHEGSHDPQIGGENIAGGSGEVYMARRKLLVLEQETRIRKALFRLKSQRSVLRQNRQRSDIPTVAVVGYTNAGKTSLIKALTGDAGLEPKDQLFATLDVTAHAGKLPNRMTAIFIDTVGFISDIPISLIDAFSATLEDAVLADLVIHVRDISHPDTMAQKLNVEQTLQKMLSHEQLSNMIEVCNKADRATESSAVSHGAILTSVLTGQGMAQLRHLVQDALIQVSGLLEKKFRIPMQGPMLSWLYKEATVKATEVNETDSEHLVVSVVISRAAYGRFKATFGSKAQDKMSKEHFA